VSFQSILGCQLPRPLKGGACSWKRIMFQDNRLIDSSPRRDVNRCNVVNGPREATPPTSKLISRWPVGFRDMSTRRTRSGCVTRIDEDHRHTGNFGFVLDERSELMESPSMRVATLSLANRRPFSNARKIFKCNRSLGVFGFRKPASWRCNGPRL